MSLKDEFLCQYKQQLHEINDIPDEITQEYIVEACLNDIIGRQTFLLSSQKDGKKYILKRVFLEFRSEQENEYSIFSSLQNAAFPKVISYFENGQYAYLLRECIKGYNLYQAVECGGVFTEQKAVEIAAAICRNLNYLHNQTPPVIHRDIKPQNIIYTPEGKAVLIDMGSARRYKKDAENDTAYVVTQATAAPEQYGFGQTDARCDIYAMGMLLVFMLTGRFGTDSKDIQKISKPLRVIILKCIKFDPKKRYANVNMLRLRLEGCLKKRKRIFRAALFACASVVLLFTGILIGWIMGTSASRSDDNAVNAASAPQSAVYTRVIIEGIDDEIEKAIGLGIVPDNIQGSWEDSITYRQYCTMIANMLALIDSAYVEQWKTTASLALNSDQAMERQEGMLALFFSAKILGETDDSGNWVFLNEKIGSDCWDDFTWKYPLFPDWVDKAFYSSDYWSDHMIAAYFFAMDSRIKDSDKRIFDYDKASNSMLPNVPLTRRDAIHSVLRLYESTFDY